MCALRIDVAANLLKFPGCCLGTLGTIHTLDRTTSISAEGDEVTRSNENGALVLLLGQISLTALAN